MAQGRQDAALSTTDKLRSLLDYRLLAARATGKWRISQRCVAGD